MPQRTVCRAFRAMMGYIKNAAELILQGKFIQAKRKIEEALRINPSLSNSQYLYSICLIHTSPSPNTLSLQQLSKQKNPCFHLSCNNNPKQILTAIIKQIKDSIPYSNESKLQQVTSSDWVEMVSACSKFKDLDTCLYIINIFEQVKKNDSQYTTYVYSNFGINLYQIGCYQRSLRMYQIAIGKFASQFRYYNNSGILCYLLGEFQRSVQFVNKSLEMKPGYPKSMFILSFPLAKMNRIQQSMQNISKAQQMTPDSLLYIFKVITNNLLYCCGLPNKNYLKQAQKFINIAHENMEQNKDNDSYFLCDENRPLLKRAIRFLKLKLKNCDKIGQNWITYLKCLDDYLIRGHADKYRIMIQMDQIQVQVEESLKTMQEVMKQSCPDSSVDVLQS